MGASAIIETAIARFWRDERGMLRGEVKPGVTITEQGARENIKVLQQLSTGIPRPLLVDIRFVRVLPHREARLLFASDDLKDTLSAVAFLIDSAVGIMMVKFFIRISKPPFPVQAFKTEAEALEWIEAYVLNIES